MAQAHFAAVIPLTVENIPEIAKKMHDYQTVIKWAEDAMRENVDRFYCLNYMDGVGKVSPTSVIVDADMLWHYYEKRED